MTGMRVVRSGWSGLRLRRSRWGRTLVSRMRIRLRAFGASAGRVWLDQAELEFRIRDDDAARFAVRDAAAVNLERQLLEPRDQITSDDGAGLFFADVFVVAGFSLGRGRKNRLRQPIGLAMDEPAGIAVDAERVAVRHRSRQPLAPERRLVELAVRSEHPQGDLRGAAPKRPPDRAPSLRDDADDIPRLGLRGDDVGSVDPRMAGADALDAAARDDTLAIGHWLSAIALIIGH